jgi:hypothetical protein
MPPTVRLRPLSSTGSSFLLALVALAGCGSSSTSSGNGVAAKSAAEIVNESRLAADSASSVHVSGSVNSSGSPVTLDLSLASGKGGTGEISQNGFAFKLVLTGTTAYISGSSAFYRHLGGAAAAQLLAGKWLKVPATTGEFSSFSSLANMSKLIDATLASHGALQKGATTTVGGQQAIAVTDTTKGGALYVATTGKPYPLQISKGGAESGKITFDRWNQPVTITPPASSVDLSELKSLSGQ